MKDKLRRWLKRPETWLMIFFCLVLLAAADSFREPRHQVTARLWVCGVRTYQNFISPRLARFVQCRYLPTCSQYSIEAVERFGIRRGLLLTLARIFSCTQRVPIHTLDPVPAK